MEAREDLQTEFNRSFEDTFRESQEQIAELLFREGISADDARSFLQGFEGDVRSRLSEGGRSQLREIQNTRIDADIGRRRERGRDLEDISRREGRQTGDAERRFERSQAEIIFEAEEQAKALQATLAPLLETNSALAVQQMETATLAATTSATAATTSMTEAETAGIAATTMPMFMEATGTYTLATEQQNLAADRLLEAGNLLVEGAQATHFIEAANALTAAAGDISRGVTELFSEVSGIAGGLFTALQFVTSNAPAPVLPIGGFGGGQATAIAGQTTGISPAGVSPSTATPQMVVVDNNITLEIDKKSLGKLLDPLSHSRSRVGGIYRWQTLVSILRHLAVNL